MTVLIILILPAFVSKRAVKWSQQVNEKTHEKLTYAIEHAMREGVPYEKRTQEILDFQVARSIVMYICGALADCFLGEQERENEEEIKQCFETSFILIFIMFTLILFCTLMYYNNKL